MTSLAFVGGIVLGTFLGMFLMALLAMAGHDKDNE